MVGFLGRIGGSARNVAESALPTRMSGERATHRELKFRYSDGPAFYFSEKMLRELRDNAVQGNLFKGAWQIFRATWEPINFLVNTASKGKWLSDQPPKNETEFLADMLRVGGAGFFKKLVMGNRKIKADEIFELINGNIGERTLEAQAGIKLVEELSKLTEYIVTIPFRVNGNEQSAWQMGGKGENQLYLLGKKNGDVRLCYGDVSQGEENWIYHWTGFAWSNATLDDIYLKCKEGLKGYSEDFGVNVEVDSDYLSKAWKLLFSISTKVDEDGEAHPLAMVFRYLEGKKKLADRLFGGNTFPLMLTIEMLFEVDEKVVSQLIEFIHASDPTQRDLADVGQLGTKSQIETRYKQMLRFFKNVGDAVAVRPIHSALTIYDELMRDAPQMQALASLRISPSQMASFFPAQFAALIDSVDGMVQEALSLQNAGVEGARQIMVAQRELIKTRILRQTTILNEIASAINATIIADATVAAKIALDAERSDKGVVGRLAGTRSRVNSGLPSNVVASQARRIVSPGEDVFGEDIGAIALTPSVPPSIPGWNDNS